MRYSEIATKDDKEFIKACRHILGHEFNEAMGEASKAFQQAYSGEPCPLKKANAGRREANLVFSDHLKANGVTNWREIANEQQSRGSNRTRKPRPPRAGNGDPGVGYKPKNAEGRQRGFLDKLMNEADQKRKGVKHG